MSDKRNHCLPAFFLSLVLFAVFIVCRKRSMRYSGMMKQDKEDKCGTCSQSVLGELCAREGFYHLTFLPFVEPSISLHDFSFFK